MKKITTLLIILATILCVCCAKQDNAEKETKKTDRVIDNLTAEVQTMRLEHTDFNYELLSNGTIVAKNKADLKFQSQENIQRIYVKNGDRVVKGQKIAELEKVKLENNLKMAQNSFGKAQLELQDVLIGQGYSLNDSEKIPEEILRIAKIRSGYTQEENNLIMARYNLDAATLYAPFSGVVANLTVKEFNQPGAEAFCTIIDNQHLEVVFNILENELPLVKQNDLVIVSPFSQSSYSSEGRITEINPSIDKNGMVRIKALLSNKDNVFVEGMNVKVRVQRLLGNRLVIPKSALVLRTNRKVVFTLKNGKAMWNYVQTEQENSESYVVREGTPDGLNVGDSVIYSGNINLAHEAPVVLKSDIEK